MDEELALIRQTFARLCASCDGSSWLNHDAVVAALATVQDQDAKTVLADLVGLAGNMDRKLVNIFTASSDFLDYLDDDFRAMLDEQEAVLRGIEDPVAKARASIFLADAVHGKLDENYQAYLNRERRNVMADIKEAVSVFRANA